MNYEDDDSDCAAEGTGVMVAEEREGLTLTEICAREGQKHVMLAYRWRNPSWYFLSTMKKTADEFKGSKYLYHHLINFFIDSHTYYSKKGYSKTETAYYAYRDGFEYAARLLNGLPIQERGNKEAWRIQK